MTDKTIDYTAAHITMLEMQVIELRAENDRLRRRLALAEAGIDLAGEYQAGVALGMAISAASEARDIGFGVTVV